MNHIEADDTTTPEPTATAADARFVFEEWDRRARSHDPASVSALLDLYTEDAALESPLVPRILEVPHGVLKGRDELHRFFTEGIKRRPNELVRWHRSGHYLFDGHTLGWEYLRQTPHGNQVDIAEIIELRGAKISSHRISWG